jgi:hypothetical protein
MIQSDAPTVAALKSDVAVSFYLLLIKHPLGDLYWSTGETIDHSGHTYVATGCQYNGKLAGFALDGVAQITAPNNLGQLAAILLHPDFIDSIVEVKKVIYDGETPTVIDLIDLRVSKINSINRLIGSFDVAPVVTMQTQVPRYRMTTRVTSYLAKPGTELVLGKTTIVFKPSQR